MSPPIFEEGDWVEQGPLLFRLDTRPYRIRTAAAAAAAKVARAELAEARLEESLGTAVQHIVRWIEGIAA